MRAWRITIEKAALDRNCEGARASGGHWHSEGQPALYAAMTGQDDLPDGWDDLEDGGSATAFGTAFLKKREYLYMRVASVIVGEGVNLVINPAHHAYDGVKLSIERSFSFDPRMFKQ